MRDRLRALAPLSLCGILLAGAVQGCGLVYDVAQHLSRNTSDEVSVICQRHQLRVGITGEPVRPFIFPAVWTDQGPRMTGMEIELIREFAGALSEQCGGAHVTPTLYKVPFEDIFLSLNEGKIDLFISAVGANVPASPFTGVAYSLPYYYSAGVGGITKRPDVVDRVRASTRRQGTAFYQLQMNDQALSGLTLAVQRGSSAHQYATANPKENRLVAYESLPGALESEDATIDVILGGCPTLQFIRSRVRPEWQLLALENREPFLLTRENYSFVLSEKSFKLRSIANKLLFVLEKTGRLAEIQRRWFEQDYAYVSRALTEGLAFSM